HIIGDNEFISGVFSTDKQNKIWVCTYNGLFEFEKVGSRLVYKGHYFTKKIITKVIKDREGNHWVSTLNEGIYIMPKNAPKMINNYNNDLSLGKVRGMAADHKGNLYFSSGIDLYTYNPNKYNSLTQFKSLDYFYEIQGLYLLGNQDYLFIQKKVNEIYSVKKQNIKVANSSSLLLSIKSLSSGSTGNVHFMTSSGYRYCSDIFTDTSYTYSKHIPDIDDPYISERGYGIHFDKKADALYLCNNFGVRLYKNGKYEEIRDGKNQIICISFYSGRDGIVWVGTNHNGIYGIEGNKIRYHFDMRSGLPSHMIKCITTDKENLWVATINGLTRINLLTNKHIQITQNDGLISTDIYRMEVLNRQIYLATAKGLLIFDINKDYFNSCKPIVYITSFLVNGKLYNQIPEIINLPWNDNNINIDFSAVGMTYRGNQKYLYKLTGLSKTWTVVDANVRSIPFFELSPGEYTFEVYAVNDDGLKSQLPGKIQFRILKPYWQTWGFRIGSLVLFLSIIIGFVRWRTSTIYSNRLKKEELINSQLATLRSQMNPHFMFNALNSIQEFIIMNQKKEANSYLGKFADLMRLILEMSQIDKVSIHKEVESLRLYTELEALRFDEAELKVDLLIAPEMDKAIIYIPPMIIQPFVENAFKHGLSPNQGANKLMTIVFAEIENAVICTITDNGIGRVASANNKKRRLVYQSFAVNASSQRLALLNDSLKSNKIGIKTIDLYDDDDVSIGTQVIVTLPKM
ncbi:MAG: histidine kinase, partial [Bacteroidota bacterium]|nr:histidine kinase [Bacteroidota bacterium]